MKLELIKKLDPMVDDQTLELYRVGENYICVSTLQHVERNFAPDTVPVLEISNFFSAILGGGLTSEEPYATEGEETLACVSDKEGTLDTSQEVAYAAGPGSRERVLEKLKEVKFDGSRTP